MNTGNQPLFASYWLQNLARALLAFSIIALSACSLPKQATETSNANWQVYFDKASELSTWKVVGKIGVRSPTQTFTAAINEWKQTDDVYQMKLSSTFFGLGASQLVGNEQFLTVYQDDEAPLMSDNPDQLLDEALKLPLPIQYIKYWVRGLPAPDQAHELLVSASGTPKSLAQHGWELSFDKFHQLDDITLPKKIKLKRKTMSITLFIGSWSI